MGLYRRGAPASQPGTMHKGAAAPSGEKRIADSLLAGLGKLVYTFESPLLSCDRRVLLLLLLLPCKLPRGSTSVSSLDLPASAWPASGDAGKP